jgi:hypothetical protein
MMLQLPAPQLPVQCRPHLDARHECVPARLAPVAVGSQPGSPLGQVQVAGGDKAATQQHLGQKQQAGNSTSRINKGMHSCLVIHITQKIAGAALLLLPSYSHLHCCWCTPPSLTHAAGT